MRIVFALALVSGLAVEAQPVINGISNTVSFQQTFAPGALATIFGSGFSTSATVTVGSIAAYVLPGGASPSQVNIQIPFNAPLGANNVVVTVGSQSSSPVAITLTQFAPALSTANGSGSGIGNIFPANSSTPISASNPASPGLTYTTYATGLGATNPAVATGASPPSGTLANVVAPVTLTLGTVTITPSFAGLIDPGFYQINFTLPSTASACATSLTLTVGSGSAAATSQTVTLPISNPAPAICAVENSALGAVRDATHAAAANSFISVYVAGMNVPDSVGSLFPTMSYQGVEVFFNTTQLPLYNVLPSVNLINTMLPSNAGSSGAGTITVKTANGTSQAYTIELAASDVGVFRIGDSTYPNQGVALLLNSYWFAMPSQVAQYYGFATPCTGLPAATPCGQPVQPNDEIVIYFTGGGLATPGGNPSGEPVLTGQVAPADGSVIYQTVTAPIVTIEGQQLNAAEILFCGIAPGTAAEYQLNLIVPAVAATNQAQVTINFGNSSDTFTIAITNP